MFILNHQQLQARKPDRQAGGKVIIIITQKKIDMEFLEVFLKKTLKKPIYNI